MCGRSFCLSAFQRNHLQGPQARKSHPRPPRLRQIGQCVSHMVSALHFKILANEQAVALLFSTNYSFKLCKGYEKLNWLGFN